MSQGPNSINNNQLTHRSAGFGGENYGQHDQKVGFFSRNGKNENDQRPVKQLLNHLVDAKPYDFSTYGQVVMPDTLAALSLSFPCVLFDHGQFGQGEYDKNRHDRDNYAWRMYVQDSTGAMYMCESKDGLTWENEQQLDVALFPAGANKVEEGLQVFYEKDGIVEVSGVKYPFSAIAKDAGLTTGDATDLYLYYSLDGITWLRDQMGNHGSTGDPFVEVASSFGRGASYMESTKESYGTFGAALPRTFRNADGDWWSVVRYNDEPANAGDSKNGETIMAMNSSTPAEYKNLGHFANWNRKLLSENGARSLDQNTNAIVHHVTKFGDFYVGLVQLWYQLAGSATRVRSGLALAISRDSLTFDFCCPLYDAGLVYAYNARTSVVDQVGMGTTAYDANQGNGTGASITAGSVVIDKDGRCFGARGGRSLGKSHFMRVYWTEQDSGKVLMGSI